MEASIIKTTKQHESEFYHKKWEHFANKLKEYDADNISSLNFQSLIALSLTKVKENKEIFHKMTVEQKTDYIKKIKKKKLMKIK